MGESDRSHRNERNLPRRRNPFLLGASNNALTALFAINAMVFVLLMVLQVALYAGAKTPGYFQSTILQWFQMPASLTQLSTRPWTLFTYMFTEQGASIFNGIANMFWLWTFGFILQSITGNSKLIPIYIYGGIVGAIFFIVAYYVVTPIIPYRGGAALLGANASVMAVAMATTTLTPGYRFFQQIRGGIPIWVLMAVYILIDFAGAASTGAGYSLAHIGGALAGYLFVVFLRKGIDGSIWMNTFYTKTITLFEPKQSVDNNKKDALFYASGNTKPFTKTSNITQKRVDEILDKISQKGYHFISDEEKAFLKKAADDKDL